MPETDSVLTTGEVQRLLDSRNMEFSALPEQPLDSIFGGASADERLHGLPGGAGAALIYFVSCFHLVFDVA